MTDINYNVYSLEDLDEKLPLRDISLNALYSSEVPDSCKEYPCQLGIDEAGRGPVLGPMVYGISFCPINSLVLLNKLGCADSKELTEEKRDEIFSKICESSKTVGWITDIISPNFICNNMLSRTKISLNEVSMNSAINLIRSCIKQGVNIAHIYIDTVGKPEKYQAYLKSLFPEYKITVEKKADAKYPIVSAASICAKVVRDHALQMWKFPEGLGITNEQFGSGYPGDPVTKEFLRKYCDPVFGYPQLVRFSWSTSENLLKNDAYHVEWDDNDSESQPVQTTTITSFFKAISPKEKGKRTRHDFFKKRSLSITTDL